MHFNLKSYSNLSPKHNRSSLLKKTLAQMFSCEFSEIFKNNFFIEHLWWLLLTQTMPNTIINILTYFVLAAATV